VKTDEFDDDDDGGDDDYGPTSSSDNSDDSEDGDGQVRGVTLRSRRLKRICVMSDVVGIGLSREGDYCHQRGMRSYFIAT
jgi:hypothetical protein